MKEVGSNEVEKEGNNKDKTKKITGKRQETEK